MKRMIPGLGLAAVLAACVAGVAVAQSEDAATSDVATIAVVVAFDSPVLAGQTASITDANGAVANVEDDYTLRIDVPSGSDPMAEIEVALAAGSDMATAKVSANEATADELVAALESAGVSPAERWAREIMEYRPYDIDDPTLAHLQDELAKYDPSSETLAGILSVLEP